MDSTPYTRLQVQYSTELRQSLYAADEALRCFQSSSGTELSSFSYENDLNAAVAAVAHGGTFLSALLDVAERLTEQNARDIDTTSHRHVAAVGAPHQIVQNCRIFCEEALRAAMRCGNAEIASHAVQAATALGQAERYITPEFETALREAYAEQYVVDQNLHGVLREGSYRRTVRSRDWSSRQQGRRSA